MKNIAGPPVEHDDFFDRPNDIARLRHELDNQANILLTAPRRVGKTSLVLRLCELECSAGRTASFINVEGCKDELSFAEKLVDGLKGSGLHPKMLTQAATLLRNARKALNNITLSAGDLKMGMGKIENPEMAVCSMKESL